MFNMLSRKHNSANQKTPTTSLYSIDYDGKKNSSLVNPPTNTGWTFFNDFIKSAFDQAFTWFMENAFAK